jgi:hypothetical protein
MLNDLDPNPIMALSGAINLAEPVEQKATDPCAFCCQLNRRINGLNRGF